VPLIPLRFGPLCGSLQPLPSSFALVSWPGGKFGSNLLGCGTNLDQWPPGQSAGAAMAAPVQQRRQSALWKRSSAAAPERAGSASQLLSPDRCWRAPALLLPVQVWKSPGRAWVSCSAIWARPSEAGSAAACSSRGLSVATAPLAPAAAGRDKGARAVITRPNRQPAQADSSGSSPCWPGRTALFSYTVSLLAVRGRLMA